MEETKDILRTFICENILAENVEIKDDSILKDVGVDSFSIVEIVLFIERRFGKLIPDHLMVPETFLSLNSLSSVVEKI